MIKWGILLLAFGGVELILPLFSRDMKIMRFFGEFRVYIGIAFAVAGLTLITLGVRKLKRPTADHADDPDR